MLLSLAITFFSIHAVRFEQLPEVEIAENRSDIVLDIDGQIIQLSQRDLQRWHFRPSDDDDENSTNQVNKDDDDDDTSAATYLDYDANGKRLTCMDNLQKFRMLAQNKPLQFVIVVDSGEEARLTCHFCENGDKFREDKSWDAMEAANGKPMFRNFASIRSPILWFRIRHFGNARTFRITEIRPSMHDHDEENRIYVTTGHTLVISNAVPEDSGTYFCGDTRSKDPWITSPLVWREHIWKMMEDRDNFKFFIHLDVLKKMNVPVKRVDRARQNPSFSYDHNVKLITVWGQWSECNRCDQPGDTFLRGTCMVKRIYDDQFPNHWYVDAVLRAQANGVPCRSTMFHAETTGPQQYNKHFFRPDEIVRKRCERPCKRTGFFKQLLSRKAMSPDGLGSIIEKDKKKSKNKVKTLNETAGTNIELICPGASPGVNVMWVNQSRTLVESTLENETDGRVGVNVTGSLCITPLTPWDRGLYLCIIDGKERGHVFLNVTVILRDDFTYYGWWVLYTLPADFVVFLFLMIIKHTHRKRILISAEDAGSPDDDDDDDDDNNSNTNTSNYSSTLHSFSRSTSMEDVLPPVLLMSSCERNLNTNSISRCSSESSFSSNSSRGSRGSSSSSSNKSGSTRSLSSRGSYSFSTQTSI